MKHNAKQLIKSIGTLACLLISTSAFAQAPQKMSYQAVIRNVSNVLVANTTVGMQISILQGSAFGTPVYVETQTPMTNSNGLASLQIGAGTVVSGTFAAIDWANGPYFIKTETDPLGGVAYTITGTSQILSTPYALYAEKAGSMATPLGKTYLILSGNVTDVQAAAIIANDVGPNTQFVWILNTTALTTVDLSSITNAVEIKINNNAALASINLNVLTDVVTDLSVQNNLLLNSISFPVLNKVSGLFSIANNAAMTSCSMPSLTSISNHMSNQFVGMPMLTSLSFPNLSTIGALQIYACPITSLNMPVLTMASNLVVSSTALSALTLPSLTSATNLNITSNSSLLSINLPILNSIAGFSEIKYNALMTSFSLPALTSVQGYFDISSNASLSALSFPVLTSSLGDMIIQSNNVLSNVSAPNLNNSVLLVIAQNQLLNSIALGNLTTCTALNILNNESLPTIALPSLTTVSQMELTSNTILNSIDISSLSVMTSGFFAYGCSLPSSQVNAILNKFLTVTPTSGKAINLESQTPAAPPTGAGITDKATLISNGQNVLTD